MRPNWVRPQTACRRPRALTPWAPVTALEKCAAVTAGEHFELRLETHAPVGMRQQATHELLVARLLDAAGEQSCHFRAQLDLGRIGIRRA